MSRNASAWFYGQPGVHAEPAHDGPDISTAFCEVCQKDLGRKCDLVPGVRKCDACRLRAALKEL